MASEMVQVKFRAAKEVSEQARQAAEASGVSLSHWLNEAVQGKLGTARGTTSGPAEVPPVVPEGPASGVLCVQCGSPASYVSKGRSLCREHFAAADEPLPEGVEEPKVVTALGARGSDSTSAAPKDERLATAREALSGVKATGSRRGPEPRDAGSTPAPGTTVKKRPYTRCEFHGWRAGTPQETVCTDGCQERQFVDWRFEDPRQEVPNDGK